LSPTNAPTPTTMRPRSDLRHARGGHQSERSLTSACWRTTTTSRTPGRAAPARLRYEIIHQDGPGHSRTERSLSPP
jgi:hypothetical protein